MLNIFKSNPSPTPVKNKFGWKKIFNFTEITPDFFSELEESFIEADVGGKNTLSIIKDFKSILDKDKIKDKEKAMEILSSQLLTFFPEPMPFFQNGKLEVFVIIGINGVGKTTTISKLVHFFVNDKKIILGAADTYRAAAGSQLKVWGERLGVKVIGGDEGTDGASVAYDSVHSSLSQGVDLCILDTAGRLHNKDSLLDQLSKLIRVTNKFEDKINVKTFLVLDATQGLSGYEQVKSFKEKINIDSLILTKTDTLAKGGTLLSISKELKIPVSFITYGEKPEQISPFSPTEYIKSLF